MKTQRQDFDLSDIINMIAEAKAATLRKAFIAYHLHNDPLDGSEQLRIDVANVSQDREFLEKMVREQNEKPCDCNGDGTCATVEAAKVALAKLDVHEVPRWLN